MIERNRYCTPMCINRPPELVKLYIFCSARVFSFC